jgi:serine/threonine protein kinase
MLIKDKVLKTLYNNARILHRDISPNNIMLARDEHANVLHALLIDFDYASTLEDNKTADSGTADVNKEGEDGGNGGNVVDRFQTVSLSPFAFPRLFILIEGNTTFYGHRDFVTKG